MIIGIDLGTTNSLVSYYGENGPEIIPNRLGENLTPSVVSIDDNGIVYVGKTAKERGALHPDQTAALFKRSMGTNKLYLLGEEKFKAEELSSFILRALKEDAEDFLGEIVEEAIISVPAYFNDMQRTATKRAGELAGLTVNRIINEPTAAALAYGLHERADHTKFLMFDLGGGTFDVSILERFGSIMEVRAIAGDNFTGGEDFTKVLYEMMLKKHEIPEEKLTEKERRFLMRQAELCKISYSEGKNLNMKCRVGEEEYEAVFSQEEYEKNCQGLLRKLRKPIERSLKDAEIRVSEIDDVVLVGGATKLPIVKSFVARIFGKIPQTSINADEAIAVGAAVQCALKERNEAVKETIFTDVCPFTLGTSVVVSDQHRKNESMHYEPIIERNTVIPASRTRKFYTAQDFQTKISVDVLQGESRFVENNIQLTEVTVPVPSGRAGEEAIEVTYTYDINSILEVIVTVLSTGVSKKVLIRNENSPLSQAEAEQRMEELNYLKIHPRKKEENMLIIARGERLYEEAKGDLRKSIDFAMSRFEKILDRQEEEEIIKARREIKEYLDMVENMMADYLYDDFDEDDDY